MRRFPLVAAAVFLLSLTSGSVRADTIRVAIGTQDTTINCATGGLIIREKHLLERYLPHEGRYKDVRYDIEWHNFTSGAPLTNEMVAGKLDFGAMADFPGSLNGAAFRKAGRRSLFISVLSGSIKGSGNGIVVPAGSDVQSLADLKGKTISVPFASTAHGMLLRAVAAQGWDPQRDVHITTQAPEIAGSALQAGRIDAHADFVPFADLFPYRGFARKIFDGSQTNAPTFHGTLVDADYAQAHPEIVVAYLRAAIEAERLVTADPEAYSELIAKTTGIEPEVDYLFHGPLGLQTRDFTWKPEYRKAVVTAFDTLKLLKKVDVDVDPATFIDDRFIRAAMKGAGLDYDARLKNYASASLTGKDALTGEDLGAASNIAQIWLRDEPHVRSYATIAHAFAALAKLDRQGTDQPGPEKQAKAVRIVYAQDRNRGIKLIATQAWFVREPDGTLDAFLLKDEAQRWAEAHKGSLLTFAAARDSVAQQRQSAR